MNRRKFFGGLGAFLTIPFFSMSTHESVWTVNLHWDHHTNNTRRYETMKVYYNGEPKTYVYAAAPELGQTKTKTMKRLFKLAEQNSISRTLTYEHVGQFWGEGGFVVGAL